jgi:hypothetical protein
MAAYLIDFMKVGMEVCSLYMMVPRSIIPEISLNGKVAYET